MAGAVLRVVIFPRHTAFYGTTPLPTRPINVKGYAKVLVTAWRGTGLGTTPASVQYHLDQSSDLEHWHEIGSAVSPPANQESSALKDLDMEWMRCRAVVSGTNPGVTGWAVAVLVPRDGEGG